MNLKIIDSSMLVIYLKIIISTTCLFLCRKRIMCILDLLKCYLPFVVLLLLVHCEKATTGLSDSSIFISAASLVVSLTRPICLASSSFSFVLSCVIVSSSVQVACNRRRVLDKLEPSVHSVHESNLYGKIYNRTLKHG